VALGREETAIAEIVEIVEIVEIAEMIIAPAETTIETDREEVFHLFEPNTDFSWTTFLPTPIGEI